MQSVEEHVADALFDIIRTVPRDEALRIFHLLVWRLLQRNDHVETGIGEVIAERRAQAANDLGAQT